MSPCYGNQHMAPACHGTQGETEAQNLIDSGKLKICPGIFVPNPTSGHF